MFQGGLTCFYQPTPCFVQGRPGRPRFADHKQVIVPREEPRSRRSAENGARSLVVVEEPLRSDSKSEERGAVIDPGRLRRWAVCRLG